MSGEVVPCPHCGQRIIVPAQQRSPERGLPADGPPPLPRRSIFPEFPLVLSPPSLDIRPGLLVTEKKLDVLPAPPMQNFARAVIFLLVIGGLWAFGNTTYLVIFSKGACCICPGHFVELPWALLAIVKGCQLSFPKTKPAAPKLVVLLQAFMCGNFDLVNTFFGILGVLIVCTPQARAYYLNEWDE